MKNWLYEELDTLKKYNSLTYDIPNIDRLIKEEFKNYKEIYLIRNELHFSIYNFKDRTTFSPDFVLFMKNEKVKIFHIKYL